MKRGETIWVWYLLWFWLSFLPVPGHRQMQRCSIPIRPCAVPPAEQRHWSGEPPGSVLSAAIQEGWADKSLIIEGEAVNLYNDDKEFKWAVNEIKKRADSIRSRKMSKKRENRMHYYLQNRKKEVSYSYHGLILHNRGGTRKRRFFKGYTSKGRDDITLK